MNTIKSSFRHTSTGGEDQPDIGREGSTPDPKPPLDIRFLYDDMVNSFEQGTKQEWLKAESRYFRRLAQLAKARE